MITSMTDWLSFLRTSDTIVGLPLVLGGLGLMIFGWRLWKSCLVISYGLIGIALGAHFADGDPNQLWYAMGAGFGLAFLSYWPVNISLAVLGGLIGGGFLQQMLQHSGVNGTLMWILAGTALLGFAALAFINRQFLVIALTAFEGSVLLVSGVVAFVMTLPGLYGTFASHGEFIVPFGLLVPTVMSCFFQVAEVRRTNRAM